jgi:hypothetical protein
MKGRSGPDQHSGGPAGATGSSPIVFNDANDPRCLVYPSLDRQSKFLLTEQVLDLLPIDMRRAHQRDQMVF